MKLKVPLLGLILVFSFSAIRSQDYTLKFAIAGLNSAVDSVQVTNLNSGSSLTLPGSQSLLLRGAPGNSLNTTGEILFFPNPMNNYSTMEFDSYEAGHSTVTAYDVSGREVTKIRQDLPAGHHSFRITGTMGGIYLVKIDANGYSAHGKLVSTNTGSGRLKIEYEKSVPLSEPIGAEKSAADLSVMDYKQGDALKFTFLSGNREATLVDIPTESKTLTASFVSCADIDNNSYPVVQIGTQVWMAKNLKTTRFNDGTAIPLVTDRSQWVGTNSAAFSWRNNDEATYREPYGALYNWYAAHSANLCPSGWHVPSESDWTALELYLGGRSIAGGKLKETGSRHWDAPNTGATDIYGFSMIGGGYRDGQGGSFYELGRGGYLWSSIEEKPTDGRNRGFSNVNVQMDLGYSVKTTGMSVRCLVDGNPPVPEPEPGTVKDYEGNVYKTVVIGKQTWMAEIPKEHPPGQWRGHP